MRSHVEGLDRLNKRLDSADFVTPGADKFLRDWSDRVKKEAQKTVRVFRGETKDSITAEVDRSKFPRWAEVFSEDPKARWLQYGTGALSEDPKSAKRAYFPPPENLRDWAASKGLDPYTVAQGIFSRGGTPPTHFFSDAVDSVGKDMSGLLSRFGGQIEFDASR